MHSTHGTHGTRLTNGTILMGFQGQMTGENPSNDGTVPHCTSIDSRFQYTVFKNPAARFKVILINMYE